MDGTTNTDLDQDQLNETKQFLIETLRIPDMDPGELGDDMALFGEGLGLDSIDALAIVVALEKTHGIKIAGTTEGQVHMRTVRTLTQLIHGQHTTEAQESD